MPESAKPSELTFNVGTLNVCDEGEPLAARACNMAAELVRMQMGVVGLQEVTAKHVSACETALPNHIRHFDAVYGHTKSGIMTLVDQKLFKEANTYRPNGRLAGSPLLVTELTSYSGHELVFVNGHLPHEIYKEGHRVLQTMRLKRELEKNYPKMPIIIARDTNSTKAAPLNLYTRMAGFNSAYKLAHGKEPNRTYPSRYGDELINNGLDGKPYEVIASRALKRIGNVLREHGILKAEGWSSPHAGCDIDRVCVNGLIQVIDAGIFADDRQEGVGPISDHLGVSARIKVRQSTETGVYNQLHEANYPNI